MKMNSVWTAGLTNNNKVSIALLVLGLLGPWWSCRPVQHDFESGETVHTDSIPLIQVSTKNNLGPFDIDTLIDPRTLEIIELQTDDRSTFAAAERFFPLADEGYLIADLHMMPS
ncbi:MAG TPA: hypothetical protein VNQ80_03655 [Parapedobacter sp.]|uniref:hypothetical protein n=1 Tax=Parapedobacter sp. TaxID=1958893 RepID=UPI002BA2620D|nr:hypothetical protein [Parapedobacter sp.]HWK56404.1 hypothetical protein [Parapedobacter sp.]